MTTLIISNEEMKIVKSFEESCLLMKGVSETTESETKEQKGGFRGMVLCTLAGSYVNRQRSYLRW